MTKQTTTLEFQGQKMLITYKDGQHYIAIRPICDALKIEYTRQFKNLKNDKILKAALAKQPMQVPNDQVRNMICLPERYIYGWLFSIRSDNDALHEYKVLCYDLLYDYFQGAFSIRQKTLQQKRDEAEKIKQLEEKLSDNPDFNKLTELQSKQKKYTRELKRLDEDLLSGQLDLFHKLLNE